MFNFSSCLFPATVVRALLVFLLLGGSLAAAAQAPAWQSAQAVATAAVGGSEVTATAVDATGNVYLAGNFGGTVVLGGTTLISLGSLDVFVAKFNPVSNQFVWAQRAGGTDYDVATTLVVNGNSVYVAGIFASITAGFGAITLTNVGFHDLFVAKLTDTGNTGSFVWAQRAGGRNDDSASALAVNGTSVYVTGYFDSPTASFGTTTLTSAGDNDVFVAKLIDAGITGSFAWTQRAGGTGDDRANALAINGSSIYVAGAFGSTASFGSATLTNAGAHDVFVTKLTDAGSTGGFGWAQRAGGSDNDGAYALVVSGTNVYVAGFCYSSPVDFSPFTLNNPNYPNASLGFLASLTDPTLTATTPPRAAPLQLYPNPAHRTANLCLPAGTTPTPLTLCDAQGRAVRRYPAPVSLETALDLDRLPSGLYLLRSDIFSQRLVVE